MLNCKDIQDIVVDERKISFTKKLSFKIHLFICNNCCKIQDQYKILDNRIRGIESPITIDDKYKIDHIIKSASRIE